MAKTVEKILELIGFWGADELKRLQTKFTKMGNGIENDAVKSKLSALYSEDEIDTLKKAVEILRGTKSKIEHAKEVKARQEKEWHKQMDIQIRQARDLLRNVVAELSFTDKVSLYLNSGLHASRPRKVMSITKNLESRSYNSLANSINSSVNQWINNKAHDLASDAIDSRSFKGIPITKELVDSIVEELTRLPIEISGIVKEIEAAAAANDFLRGVLSNITDKSKEG